MHSTDSFSSLESPRPLEKKALHKTTRRRKVRRLVDDTDKVEIDEKGAKQEPRLRYFKLSIFAVAMVAVSTVAVHDISTEKIALILTNFLGAYKRQYYQILYGNQDYCNYGFLTHTLFERIHPQILNQEEAVQELEYEMRKSAHVISIALVGPSGVGKTLLARVLLQNFPWPDNVHSYAWNTFVSDTNERQNLLRLYLNGLSDCGRNLLIMDNLMPSDYGLVETVHEKLKETLDRTKHVIIIYIFNLSTFYSDEVYQNNFKLLQTLTNTKTINFKQFDVNDLFDCIEHEAKLENVTLKSTDIDEILKTINVKHSGCKNVRAKVLMYGQKIY